MCPELERLSLRLGSENLGGGDMDCIERAHIDGKRTLRALDHGAVDRGQVQHGEEVAEFLPLGRRLDIVEVAEQTLSIHRPKRLNLDQLEETTRSLVMSGTSGPGSSNRMEPYGLIRSR